ncbi:MAG: lytic transglycosylase domain-containing protein [Bacteroidota bacterium]
MEMKNETRLWKTIYLLTSLVIVLVAFIALGFTYDSTGERIVRSFKQDYAIFALDIPEGLNFAGEVVPINNFDVRESFDRELLVNTYWQSQTLLFIKRANKYFPVIEKILQENNIPDDFKYLALAESGLQNAVSPAGAVGFWQLLKGTAEDYGLEVNREVDERYHMEKATEAACRYLRDSYKLYGNWTMVAASYNMGRNGLRNQVERQKESNYYDLLLNDETSRYVFRILAIKSILNDSEKYGFYVKNKDLYQHIPYYEVEIDSAVLDFADFAKLHNTNYKMLKYLNPWLRDRYLTNRHKNTYVIKIPYLGARTLVVPEEMEINTSVQLN